MSGKMYSNEEVNRIVAGRVGKERARLTREFENKMKRCMASIHLMLHQEMCSLKWELVVEPKDTVLSGIYGGNGAPGVQSEMRPTQPVSTPANNDNKTEEMNGN